MVGVGEAFFASAIIIFIGYFGLLFFKKTKISEIIVLMTIGLLIGPVFGLVGSTEIAIFQGFLPFFASFALMVVLFEGGMCLNFFHTIKDLPGVLGFTVLVFTFTVTLISAAWFFFTGNLLYGILLGAIIGGTSSAIVIPLVNNTSAKENTKTLLGLESAFTDVLCVIVAVTVASIIALLGVGSTAAISISAIGSSILGALSIAALLGFVFGIGWIRLLPFFEKKPYEYLVTLAVLMFLYALTEYFGGNGAIAALVFGIVLGNSEDLTTMLRISVRKVEPTIKSFQTEVTFLVRTFFFVYLGLLFIPSYINDYYIIGMSIIVLIAVLLARYLGTRVLVRLNDSFKGDAEIIATMNARGLAAASLIAFPSIVGLNLGDTFTQMNAIVFIVILFSNVLTTMGVFLYEQKKRKKQPAPKEGSLPKVVSP